MNRLLQRWLEREKPLFPKLRAIPLFRELNRRDLQAVVEIIEIRKYSTGDVVFEQGALGDGIYVVLKVVCRGGSEGWRRRRESATCPIWIRFFFW